MRAEGLTELGGDIVLNCTGAGVGGRANFNVFVGNTVFTSRIVGDVSEALLMIDEPGSPLSVDNPAELGVNVFQGVVDGNTVTFNYIPIVPPGTSSTLPAPTRIYRITNLRVNATTIGAGPGGTPGQVQAYISISGSTSVPINNPTQVIGFVKQGLTFDSDSVEFRQCDTIDSSSDHVTLTYTEGFASSFKAQGSLEQGEPGHIYFTESGISPIGTDGPIDVGAVADWGTRLRATFDNIPLGTAVYVSRVNNGAEEGYLAELNLADETEPFDGAGSSGYTRIVKNTATSGVANWEILEATSTITEEFSFDVYFVTSPNGQESPAAGVQGTVAGSFAPAPPAFDLADYSEATEDLVPRFIDTGEPNNLIIFNICQTNLLFPYVLGGVAGFDTGLSITNTSADPWDTSPQSGTCDLHFFGKDGTGATPDVYTTPTSIGSADTDSGVLWADTAMNLAPGFTGYIIAICNFQYAHGFAFVSDIGAHNIAMGYLALILPDVERFGRPARTVVFVGAENLNQ